MKIDKQEPWHVNVSKLSLEGEKKNILQDKVWGTISFWEHLRAVETTTHEKRVDIRGLWQDILCATYLAL